MEQTIGNNRLVVWDYAVIGVVLLVTVLIGFYHALTQRRKSNADYFLMAGRNMGALPVTLSVLATYFSAISMLGVPVEIYFHGTQTWMFVISYMVVIPFTAHCLLPVFYKAGVTSAYEYLELRFSKVIRKIASGLYVIQTILFTVVILYAPSLSLSQVTGGSIWTSVVVIGVICITYTALGGMRAVLWTDSFQIIIMFAATSAIVIKGCTDLGGIQQVWTRAEIGQRIELFNFDFDPTLRQSFWSVAVGSFFTWCYVYGINQSMVQRYMTTKNIETAQRALWWNLPGLLVMTSLYCLAGLVIYARYWDCDPLKNGLISAKDQMLPYFVMNNFGVWPGIPGLFIASVACATLSTMSSNLNGLTTVTLEDFILCNISKLSEKKIQLLVKLLPIAYGGLTMSLVAVAALLGGLVQAIISIFGMVGGPLLGVFLLGMFVPLANNKGAIAGLIAGFGIALFLGIGSQVAAAGWPSLPTGSGDCRRVNGTDMALTHPVMVQTMAMNINGTVANDLTTGEINNVFPVFQLSFLWYSAVSCLTVVLVGVAVSCVTNGNFSQRVDSSLISPVMMRLFCRKTPVQNYATAHTAVNASINTLEKVPLR